MHCGVGRRWGSDPLLLWLWCRPAAVAPIRPLAWKLPYAAGTALKSKIIIIFLYLFVLNSRIFSFCVFRATPSAYGDSQASGLIRAVAAALNQSHSNMGSELHLQSTPQLNQILNPLSKARDGTCNLMVPSWIH